MQKLTNDEINKLKEFKIEEQKLLKKIFPQHKVDLKLDYERWDCLIEEKKYLIEVKTRDFTYEEFINQNGKYKSRPLIEEEKYFECILKATELNYKFLYIYCFSCGSYIIYNLSDSSFNPIKFYQTQILCPKHSFTDNKEMVMKNCFIIPSWMLKLGENSHLKKMS